MSFSEKIKILRIKNGYTQSESANPDMYKAVKIAKFMDITDITCKELVNSENYRQP